MTLRARHCLFEDCGTLGENARVNGLFCSGMCRLHMPLQSFERLKICQISLLAMLSFFCCRTQSKSYFHYEENILSVEIVEIAGKATLTTHNGNTQFI